MEHICITFQEKPAPDLPSGWVWACKCGNEASVFDKVVIPSVGARQYWPSEEGARRDMIRWHHRFLSAGASLNLYFAGNSPELLKTTVSSELDFDDNYIVPQGSALR